MCFISYVQNAGKICFLLEKIIIERKEKITVKEGIWLMFWLNIKPFGVTIQFFKVNVTSLLVGSHDCLFFKSFSGLVFTSFGLQASFSFSGWLISFGTKIIYLAMSLYYSHQTHGAIVDIHGGYFGLAAMVNIGRYCGFFCYYPV